MKKNEYIEMSKELLSFFIEANVSIPANKLIESNSTHLNKLGKIIVTIDSAQDLIGKACYKPNKNRISRISRQDRNRIDKIIKAGKLSISDREFALKLKSDTCSKVCLLSYINRQIYFLVVTVLCASYISSFILLRSILEILINVSVSDDDGRTRKNIDKITFFNSEEKKSIKNIWDELCAWSHPYKKWTNNICPTDISTYPPIYHPNLADDCIALIFKILDIYLVVSKEHFLMNTNDFYDNEGPIDIADYPFFKKRISE